VSNAARQEVSPADVARLLRRRLRRAIEHDHVLDGAAAGDERFVDNLLQPDVLALPIRRVRREDEPRAARGDAVRERLRTEPGEDHRMNRADPKRREHQDDRFDRRRHVDSDPIALADVHAAQRGSRPLHLVTQLRVGEHVPFSALVQVNERGTPAVTRLDVPIDRVVREVGLCTDEPPEGRRRPVEYLVPCPKPRKRAGRFRPERLGLSPRILNPAIDDRIDECH
jgi:hypothetical protein